MEMILNVESSLGGTSIVAIADKMITNYDSRCRERAIGVPTLRNLRENPNVVKNNVAHFEDEISLLGENPVLVALGTTTHQLLVTYLGHKHTIAKIMHYSYAIGKEDYRKAVLKILDQYP